MIHVFGSLSLPPCTCILSLHWACVCLCVFISVCVLSLFYCFDLSSPMVHFRLNPSVLTTFFPTKWLFFSVPNLEPITFSTKSNKKIEENYNGSTKNHFRLTFELLARKFLLLLQIKVKRHHVYMIHALCDLTISSREENRLRRKERNTPLKRLNSWKRPETKRDREKLKKHNPKTRPSNKQSVFMVARKFLRLHRNMS